MRISVLTPWARITAKSLVCLGSDNWDIRENKIKTTLWDFIRFTVSNLIRKKK